MRVILLLPLMLCFVASSSHTNRVEVDNFDNSLYKFNTKLDETINILHSDTTALNKLRAIQKNKQTVDGQ